MQYCSLYVASPFHTLGLFCGLIFNERKIREGQKVEEKNRRKERNKGRGRMGEKGGMGRRANRQLLKDICKYNAL